MNEAVTNELENAHGLTERRTRLVGAATRLLGSPDAAEDVVQEALLRYVERAGPTLDASDAWLFSVTRNLAIDRLRRHRLERETPPSARDVGLGGGEPAPSPDEELEHGERCREAIRRLLERSTPRDVATTLLREVFGSDYADIARAGGRSPTGCRQAVHRTLERARRRAPDRTPTEEEPAVTRADAVVERFASAVLGGHAAPLYGALRDEPRAAAPAPSRLPAHRDVSGLHVELDAYGVRVSLRLGRVTLCTVGRAAPSAAALTAPD